MKIPEFPDLHHDSTDTKGAESSQASAAELYGYGDASPDVKNSPSTVDSDIYGYGRVTTTGKYKSRKYDYDGSRVPRRSSMKGGYGTSSSQRRASIGSMSSSTIEVRVRGQRMPVQRRRSIDFSNTVQVKEVTPVTDAVGSDEIWLQPDEFAKMKLDRKKVIQKFKRGEAKSENPEDDIRGLEKYVDKSIRAAKNQAWDTVLLEQDEQEFTGRFNDQRLADLYKTTTYRSPDKAVAAAQADQQAVQDYLMSPRTRRLMMRRLSC